MSETISTHKGRLRRDLACCGSLKGCKTVRNYFRRPTVFCLSLAFCDANHAMRHGLCNVPYVIEGMNGKAEEPATKLHKSTIGDVTAVTSPQAAMASVTPDQPEAKGLAEAAGHAGTVAPLLNETSIPQMEGGKKRKVALYISYIGAGYHVSAVTPCRQYTTCEA